MRNEISYAWCKMSASLFVEANNRKYDSIKFAEKLMLSEYGDYLYSDRAIEMWLGHMYVMETLIYETGEPPKGEIYPTEFMEWAGYLYRYWSQLYPKLGGNAIYKKAPLTTLAEGYLGWHCMDFGAVVEELME